MSKLSHIKATATLSRSRGGKNYSMCFNQDTTNLIAEGEVSHFIPVYADFHDDAVFRLIPVRGMYGKRVKGAVTFQTGKTKDRKGHLEFPVNTIRHKKLSKIGMCHDVNLYIQKLDFDILVRDPEFKG